MVVDAGQGGCGGRGRLEVSSCGRKMHQSASTAGVDRRLRDCGPAMLSDWARRGLEAVAPRSFLPDILIPLHITADSSLIPVSLRVPVKPAPEPPLTTSPAPSWWAPRTVSEAAAFTAIAD
jgi:hypothetical protein